MKVIRLSSKVPHSVFKGMRSVITEIIEILRVEEK
jgi:hypothetical protein